MSKMKCYDAISEALKSKISKQVKAVHVADVTRDQEFILGEIAKRPNKHHSGLSNYSIKPLAASLDKIPPEVNQRKQIFVVRRSESDKSINETGLSS